MFQPVSEKLLRLIPSVGIALILGSEGSGKSVLGYGILEALKDSGRKLLVYGLPLEKSIHLPDWIGVASGLDFPEESVVLADEAYLQWHSRDSMGAGNKFMDAFSGLVRQKDILAIYVTQTSRKLDIGLVSAPRVLLIKEPSLLQMRLDRSELRPILTDASQAFRGLQKVPAPRGFVKAVKDLEGQQGTLGADTMVSPRSVIATYVLSNTFEGMLDASNRAPSFWSEALSKAWKGISLLDEALPTFQRNRTECIAVSEAGELICNQPAVGVCVCHGNSYCQAHSEGHIMSARR